MLLQTPAFADPAGKARYTARRIVGHALRYATHKAVMSAGRRWTAGVDGHASNRLALVQSILNGVRRDITYRHDPATVEFLITPDVLLSERQGDCDDFSALTCAVLLSVGVPCRVVIWGPSKRGNFQHVFAEAMIAPGRWVPVDGTLEQPEHAARLVAPWSRREEFPIEVRQAGMGDAVLVRTLDPELNAVVGLGDMGFWDKIPNPGYEIGKYWGRVFLGSVNQKLNATASAWDFGGRYAPLYAAMKQAAVVLNGGKVIDWGFHTPVVVIERLAKLFMEASPTESEAAARVLMQVQGGWELAADLQSKVANLDYSQPKTPDGMSTMWRNVGAALFGPLRARGDVLTEYWKGPSQQASEALALWGPVIVTIIVVAGLTYLVIPGIISGVVSGATTAATSRR